MSEHTADTDSAPDGAALLRGLLDVLDLRDAGTDDRGQDLFVGDSQPQPHGRVFGGQVLGQTLVAAGRTVQDGRPVHSMHGYFLRPGDSNEPITFAVERLRDGRSFSARRVHAIQFDQPILSMIASFQDPSPGLDHQDAMPEVPAPEDLPTTAQLMGHIDHPVAQYWARARPMDLRHVDAPVYWQADPDRRATNAVWMRTPAPMPDDPLLHRAVLGYASDYTLLESVLRRHGVTWATRGLKAASLDHAMWWHRDVRVDEWLLYVQASPSASGARGLGTGRIFSRDGRLVATVAQEGMLRVPADAT
ncbi:MAG TPA: acyl-CoA thioesterase II [Angustibacter sp.]|nr:acyl-CoA thioesterase II [Angustibacter sp.]